MTTGDKVWIGIGVAAAAAGAIGIAAVLRKRSGAGALGAANPEKIGALQDSIWSGVRNPQLRELALAITGNGARTVTVGSRTLSVQGASCPPRDGRCESNAIGSWVAQNRAQAGTLLPGSTNPPTALACALLSLNGITCRLRLAQGTAGERVYSMAGLPKNRPSSWSAVDVEAQQYRFGAEPSGFGSKNTEDFDG